jgi:hypothetical protein
VCLTSVMRVITPQHHTWKATETGPTVPTAASSSLSSRYVMFTDDVTSPTAWRHTKHHTPHTQGQREQTGDAVP